jgi:long-chain acyl-CoA synthetase
LPCCELQILDADAAGVGEILVRTPSAMSGYWGQPEANIVDRDGWIHTGDLGRNDAQGWVYVTGRAKDIIIRGGENVSSVAIEQRLLKHPAVLEAAVVGLPHADLGEQVGAVVVLRNGRAATNAELAAFAGETLAYFQVPEHWWVRADPLPTNAAGKVLKTRLQSEWTARTLKPTA